jgi:hypothetical protein
MTYIKISVDSTGFSEDKDEAKRLRTEKILPALKRGEAVVLDFGDVRSATQSFVHALISEPLSKYHEKMLETVEFKNCTRSVRGVIEFVVDYSLSDFLEREAV